MPTAVDMTLWAAPAVSQAVAEVRKPRQRRGGRDDLHLLGHQAEPVPHPARPTALVTVDQEAGAYAATRHLLDAGHATVWHVSGPGDWFDARGRISGWRRALTEAGAEIPPLMPADWQAAVGYRNGQILARMSEVTAVSPPTTTWPSASSAPSTSAAAASPTTSA